MNENTANKSDNIIYSSEEDFVAKNYNDNVISSKASIAPPPNTNTTNVQPQIDSETEVFDRIAAKLLKSNLLLTALELHAELIERGRELPRLREYFDNPHNFERQSNPGGEPKLFNPDVANLTLPPPLPPKSIHSEHTFDSSLDFTHYSDDADGGGGPGDERIAVLEFELRKAQQTIDSLRASLTLSTTTGLNPEEEEEDDVDNDNSDSRRKSDQAIDLLPNLNQNPNSSQVPPTTTMTNFTEFTATERDDFYQRGSADGDSCPGDEELQTTTSSALSSNPIAPNNQQSTSTRPSLAPRSRLSSEGNTANFFSSTTSFDTNNSNTEQAQPHPPTVIPPLKAPKNYSLATAIKPHEKRALNFLINEYLMANAYKLTAITFSEEHNNLDLDFDSWDDVGLNTDRPPDLLRLYRYFWQNCAALLHRTNSMQSSSNKANNNNNSSSIFDD